METWRKAHELNTPRHLYGLANMVVVDCEGGGREKSRGLMLMWKNDVIVTVLSFSLNHIDMEVEEVRSGKKWWAIGI